MRAVIPIANLTTRLPEHGRIRIGVKTERAMKSIDTFRFTSPDETAIREISEVYGGVVKPWNEPRASNQHQWEVITTHNEVRVFLPPDALSRWYEEWSGGGCVKRCDGVVCQVPQRTGPDAGEMVDVPCICDATKTVTCRPYTRLTVILPEIRFGGGWRLETKSWNAAQEMPAMEAMIDQLQAVGIVEARLLLEQRTQVKNGKTKHFVVPKLLVDTSPLAILQGQATVGALTEGRTPPALTAAPEWYDEPDDTIVDAEVIDHEDPPNLTDRAAQHAGGASNPVIAALLTLCSTMATMLTNRGVIEVDDTTLANAVAYRTTKGTCADALTLDEPNARKAMDSLERVRNGEFDLTDLVPIIERFRAR